MWYECLPPLAIMGVMIVVPHYIFWAGNLWVTGHPHRRNIFSPTMYGALFRDMRVGGGDPYNVQGLDKISDEPVKKSGST